MAPRLEDSDDNNFFYEPKKHLNFKTHSESGMNPQIKEQIKKLTLEEKASLCSGLNFWTTQPVDSQNIPALSLCDGPHGLRKVVESNPVDSRTIPATCFPPACGLASSWNIELMEQVGKAIGRECRSENVAVVLGPGVNIKRSPLCGRNFEYFSEDPVLSGAMGTAWVQGVQSLGVGTSLKHYAANNQETERMSVDVQLDRRTLHEIYLYAFEQVVKEAQPWTVMCAYNKLNGTLCSENEFLLTDILRKRWGFDGIVISDWGAVDFRDRALVAGLDLQMPGTDGVSDQDIVAAIQQGTLEEAVLDQTVERHLQLVEKALEPNKPEYQLDLAHNHQIAKEAASESIVLLKNDNKILPLNPKATLKVGVIGEFAKHPRTQGGGSSHVQSTQMDIPLDEIVKQAGEGVQVQYASGYQLEHDETQPQLLEEALQVAQGSDVVLVFVGLPEHYESEGYDRPHMEIPPSHTDLIEAIAKVHSQVVVIVTTGSAITMTSWISQVSGVLLTWLLGQAGGSAISNIVWGVTNPSGKLTETLALRLEDTPAYLNFPGKQAKVHYQEGVFIGYRYYDFRKMDVLFPFGYGLSYTQFEYSDLQVNHTQIKDTDTVEVTLSVTNIGSVFGKEIVQLYLQGVECQEQRPLKELKAFSKIGLEPNETKTVSFSLSYRDFAYFDETKDDWHVESGDYVILVGASSQEIYLQQDLSVESTNSKKPVFTRHSTIGEILQHKPEIVEALLNQMKSAVMSSDSLDGMPQEMLEAFLKFMPLRGLYHWSKGAFTPQMLEQMLERLNAEE